MHLGTRLKTIVIRQQLMERHGGIKVKEVVVHTYTELLEFRIQNGLTRLHLVHMDIRVNTELFMRHQYQHQQKVQS